MSFSVCVAHFKSKSDSGPSKKKKCKKKNFKERGPNEKTSDPQQKPSPSTAAQKGAAKAKKSDSKAEGVNGSTALKQKGNILCLPVQYMHQSKKCEC